MNRLILAISDNHVIGNGGQLPWRLSADLKNFRDLTRGTQVVMGRATFDSLQPRGLPERILNVVSHTKRLDTFTTRWFSSYEEVRQALTAKRCHVSWIGGRSCAEYALTVVEELSITRVHRVVEGDAYLHLNPAEIGFKITASVPGLEAGTNFSIETWKKDV